ncbi:hypothetical protein V8G54_025348 [Vigna mungo]|uniref:Uncharacterized protein n=1 Tax=Vigna mungo TaxID=3915 RepID=A0AAQ3MY58_VIGMU
MMSSSGDDSFGCGCGKEVLFCLRVMMTLSAVDAGNIFSSVVDAGWQDDLNWLVDVKLGLAMDSLESLILNGEAGSVTMMYDLKFHILLLRVKVGGLIVIDNVLWHGKVADQLVYDPKTVSIRNFNQKLMEDERINISMNERKRKKKRNKKEEENRERRREKKKKRKKEKEEGERTS